MKKIRVLRISHSGVVPEYRKRERALSELDCTVELIVPTQWPHIGTDPATVLGSEPFDVHLAQTYLTGSIPLFAFDPSVIRQRLIEFRPDVLDIHEEPYSVSGFECVALAKMINPNQRIVIYSAQNISKRYPPPFVWMERHVMNTVDAAYPCSEGVKEVLVRKGFAKPAEVIPLGVDTHLFAPSNQRAGADSFVVGFAGRLEASKGLEVLLRALYQLKQEIGVGVSCSICGTGSGATPAKQLAAELGIEAALSWVGEIPASAMASFYQSCDVVVVPSLTTSRWKEQFGRSAAEAMSCGVPVIVSDSGSLPEVVGNAGIVVSEGSADALKNALLQLYRSSDLRRDLAVRARERVLERFTWGKVAEQMRVMYQRVLEAT